MAREPVKFGQVTETLTPKAAPIDTYMRPGEPQRSPLYDIASALGGFERSLDAYVEQRKQSADKLDAARAVADHYKNNGAGYADGVASGAIPSFASPAYVDAYKSAEGAAKGNQLMLQAQAEYMKWDGKDGTDPVAFDKFSQDFLARNIKETDPRVLRGMLPVIHTGMQSLQSQFHQDLSQAVYKGNIEKHGIVSSQTIDAADTEGFKNPTGTDYEALWGSLMTTRENALRVGAKPDDYDKTLIKTLTEKSLEKRDPGLLKLLDRKLPGSTYALSDTQIGASVKLETGHKLETLGRQAMIDAEHRAAKAEKAAKDTTHRTAIELLAADPAKALPEDLLTEGQKHDPEYRVKVIDWQKKLSEAGVAEDPKAQARLYDEIFNGGGMAAVSKALTDGNIRSAQGLKEATAYAKAVEDGGGVGHKILQGGTVSTILDTIAKRAPGKDPLSNPFGTPGPSDAGLQAQTEYRRLLIDWALRHPDASEFDKEKARSDIGGVVLKGLTSGVGTDASYIRAPDAAIKDLGAEPGALPPRPAVPNPPPMSPIETFKQGFTPEQRATVEKRAADRGLDPAAVWAEVYKAAQPNPDKLRLDQLQKTYTPKPQSYIQQPGATPSLAAISRVSFSAPVSAAITEASAAHGLDQGLLTQYAKIESGGDPSNTTGSYKGLFQLSDAEFNRYGPKGGDIYDPNDNALAAAAKLKAEAGRFQAQNGRAPSATDLYLVHQQGEAGYAAHMKNPQAPAWENMWSTAEGQAKGERWAKLAVWGNIPTTLRARFPGGVDTVTSADFIDIWRHKVEGTPLGAAPQVSAGAAQAPLTAPHPDATANWLKRFASRFGVQF